MVEWRFIPGYAERYQASDDGRVRNCVTGRILKPFVRNPKGYLGVGLRAPDGSKHIARVHRCVAAAFIPNPDGLPQVNHIDFDKTNNRRANLEWCTGSANIQHSLEVGYQCSLKHPKCAKKLSTDDVLAIRQAYAAGEDRRAIAARFNCQPKTISAIALGKMRKYEPGVCEKRARIDTPIERRQRIVARYRAGDPVLKIKAEERVSISSITRWALEDGCALRNPNKGRLPSAEAGKDNG